MNPLSHASTHPDHAAASQDGPGATAAAAILEVALTIKALPPGDGPAIAPHFTSRHAYLHNRQDVKAGEPAVQDLQQDSEDGTDLAGKMWFNGSACADAEASGDLTKSNVRVLLPRQAWSDYAIFLSEARHRDMVTLPARTELTLSGHAKGSAALPDGAEADFTGGLSAQAIVSLSGPLTDQQQIYRNEASTGPQGARPPFSEKFALRYANNSDNDITVEIGMAAYVTGTVGTAPDDATPAAPSRY